MKTRQEIIDEAMDYIDFYRIHAVMKFLNWEYANVGIPEIPYLRRFVRNLLNILLDQNLKEISCGGFYILKRDNYIDITFQINGIEINTNDKMV